MSLQLQNAMWRGLIIALIAGFTSFFTSLTQINDPKLLLSAFALPFLTVLGTRWFGEGFLDTSRAEKGQLIEGHAAERMTGTLREQPPRG